MEEKSSQYNYPVYKGIMRPIEFMGLKGRFIIWGVVASLGSLILFFVAYILLGILWGLISSFSLLLSSVLYIIINQKKGLHSKKINKGIFCYDRIFK